MVARTIPVNSNTLTAIFISKEIDLFHVLCCCSVREVHRFRNSIIHIPLKSCLHLYVFMGCNMMCCSKELFDIFRHLIKVLYQTFICNPFHKLSLPEAPLFCDLLEIGIYLYQFCTFHHCPHIGDCKNRFYTGGATCYDRESACRSYGRNGCISYPHLTIIDTAFIIGKCPSLLSQCA